MAEKTAGNLRTYRPADETISKKIKLSHCDKDPFEKRCCGCNTEIDEEHLCNMCSFGFCTNCFNSHNANILSMMPHLPECQAKCLKHHQDITMYCREQRCTLSICKECASECHKSHDIIAIGAQCEQASKETRLFARQNENRYYHLTKAILSLKGKKEGFEKNVSAVKSMVWELSEDIVQIVNEIRDVHIKEIDIKEAEVAKEFSDGFEMLEKRHSEAKKIMQQIAHFPPDLPAHDVLMFNMKLKNSANMLAETPTLLCGFKSLAFKLGVDEKFEIKDHVNPIFGKTFVTLNKIEYTHFLREPILTTHYEENLDVIKDFSYDMESGNLFVLIFRRQQYFIKKLFHGEVIKEFNVDPSYKMCQRISILLDGSILLNYGGKLKLLAEDLVHYKPLHEDIIERDDVSTVCSSICKTYLYICCKSFIVYAYNVLTNETKYRYVTDLPSIPSWMAVSKNFEYLAFTGSNWKGVYCCFPHQTDACRLFSRTYSYGALTFLADNLIAYNETRHLLEIFCCKANECLQRIEFFNKDGRRDYFRGIHAIAMCSSNALLINDSSDEHAIYRLVL